MVSLVSDLNWQSSLAATFCIRISSTLLSNCRQVSLLFARILRRGHANDLKRRFVCRVKASGKFA